MMTLLAFVIGYLVGEVITSLKWRARLAGRLPMRMEEPK